MENLARYPDIRQSPAHARFMQSLGWQITTTNGVQMFIKRLPGLPFSLMKIQRFNQPIKLSSLAQVIKTNRIIFVKIEPQVDFLSIPDRSKQLAGFKPDRWPLTPSQTIWLNLTLNQQQLLKQMKPKTRYNIGLAEKKGLKMNILPGSKITPAALTAFYRLWRQRAKKIHLGLPGFQQLHSLQTAFGQDFWLLTALHNDQLTAGLIILKYQQTAWYWHNASSRLGQQLFAPTLLTWEAIKHARRLGCRRFDFEGIYDPRFSQATRKWQGFSRFKAGFGGQKIQFPGPITRWFNPFK